MTQEDKKARTFLRNIITKQQDALIAITRTLVKTPSPNPAGNTVLVADAAIKLLQSIPHAHVSRHETAPGLVNVVARIPSGRPGKRLVFNGHLDTYPLCEDLNWTVPPLGGVLKDGRLYGRGVCDMKGGIAASITAAKLLAEHRDLWRGEIVVTLAGDEECMGSRGAKWLLDNVEAAKGDAMICGDAGSPQVVRFGEKGFVWIDVEAKGVAAHGAHVHRGLNAVNRLRKALDAIETLEEMGGGYARGGGGCDRCGGRRVTSIVGHGWRIIRKCDPNYTSPTHDIVQLGLKVSKEVTGGRSVASIRVGASDTRWNRAAGFPTVVVGCSGGNMGGSR
ncbi:succinyl-diaminopimelate desuccinylase [Coccidioides immitis H538.4]|uniref:Succinyl-diaminopimelate desuccinylase n=1 Tax=Coccidioides immitis H538.4 TaxID=396776 RepID=A0A0J8U6Q8_COCIT|nr:succinyl-diaminopimelate desuccinylase [Coccidioides immitis H538.4]